MLRQNITRKKFDQKFQKVAGSVRQKISDSIVSKKITQQDKARTKPMIT